MSTQILKKSNDMILFTHDLPIRQGQAIKFGDSYGVVMSIFERNQLALLLKQSDNLEPLTNVESLQPYPQDNVCTIADIKESFDNVEENKHHNQRFSPKSQVLTNNIYIDLFHPITFGQLLIIKDEKLLSKLRAFDQIIYYSRSQITNGIWFKSSENQGANYFMPRFALQYAKQQAKQKSTLLIVDQVYEHMIANQKLQETIQSYLFDQTMKTVYLSDLLKQLSEASGYRPNQSNLTVAVLQRDSKDDLLNEELDKELESLQSQTPVQQVSKPSPFNLNIQTPLYYHLAQQLYSVLSKHDEQKQEYLQKQSLKIHIDPWDFYQYFDSKPIVEMIKIFNSQDRQEHELVLLADFSVRAFHDELICQLKGSPNDILNDLLGFASQIREFQEKNFGDYYYERQQQLDSIEFKNDIIENLGRFYELYMLHLRMTDQLLQYKKDYI